MTELDAGLHHDTDGSREGIIEPDRRKGGAMDLDGAQGRLGPRHPQMIESLRGAPRHRHLCADDIARTTSARCSCSGFGNAGEAGRAMGRHLVGQSRILSATPHAGVEMELGEAGARKGVDHDLGFAQCLFGRQRLPGVGAEMVAAEDQPARVETDLPRDADHEITEARRRHAGVAAILVDLVAGCLDQNRRPVDHAL